MAGEMRSEGGGNEADVEDVEDVDALRDVMGCPERNGLPGT